MTNDTHDLTHLTFEDAYAQLQAIAAQLETGDLSLDESVALYARGQVLARHCGDLLDSAELRIEQIDDTGQISGL